MAFCSEMCYSSLMRKEKFIDAVTSLDLSGIRETFVFEVPGEPSVDVAIVDSLSTGEEDVRRVVRSSLQEALAQVPDDRELSPEEIHRAKDALRVVLSQAVEGATHLTSSMEIAVGRILHHQFARRLQLIDLLRRRAERGGRAEEK